MNKKYTTLLFDLDDTLLDFGKAEDNAICKLFADYGIPATEENKIAYSAYNKTLWAALEKGEITRQQLFDMRFTEFFARLGIDADGVEANSKFISYVAQGGFILDGALETCKKLHNYYKMYIITNGSKKAQRGRLTGSPLMEYFDGVFISEEIGFVKPQREYFDFVFGNIDETDKSKVLVIGDSLTSDIKGASDYGLDSCWVTDSNADSPATFRINTVAELTKII